MSNDLLFFVRMQWNKQNYTYEKYENLLFVFGSQVRSSLSLGFFSGCFIKKCASTIRFSSYFIVIARFLIELDAFDGCVDIICLSRALLKSNSVSL